MPRFSGVIAFALTTALAGAAEGPLNEEIPKEVLVMSEDVRKPKFGPPPPGYIRITGEPVPGWAREHQFQRSGSLNWAKLGPEPIFSEFWSGEDDASGRVVSVVPHPVDPDIVYIASASGGIWKTSNAGITWMPMSDELSTLNHGFVVLDPSDSDTVYAGTGEYTTGSTGDGLFRSTDAGMTWDRVATSAQVGSRCSGVVVDASDPEIIHVSGNSGVHRTVNGGVSWSNRLAGPVSSLVVHSTTPSILYAGRAGDGVYKSIDSGTSWTRLSGGLPGSGSTDRIVLSISRSSPNIIYVAIMNGSSLQGFYRSDNDGASWVNKPATPNFPSPQGWYDVFVGVSPTAPDTVFCGGVDPRYANAGVIRTTNGGNSWAEISEGPQGGQLHPDHHAVGFGPTGTVWACNDGGVWKSDNNGNTWINTNATLTLTQNYAIALHPADMDQAMMGTQDNGTVEKVDGNLSWPQLVSGDGGFLAYDQDDPDRRYTTYVFLRTFRITSDTFDDITPNTGDPANFIAPLVMDPNDSDTLLGGTNRVWRTTNASTTASWSPISPSSVGGGGTLNAIAVAEGNSSIIYCGSTAGTVYQTSNAAIWTNRSAGLPGGQVSDIFVEPNNGATAYVTFFNTSGARVFKTTNFGADWTNVTGDLPAGAGARALEVDWDADPNHLYVGSGSGVYCSFDDGATWEKDGPELPNVNIGDLAIDRVNRVIAAGTYGRGAWRADLPSLVPCIPDTAAPFGTLDFFDILGFLFLFDNLDPGADLAAPFGTWDFFDVLAYLELFDAGCP